MVQKLNSVIFLMFTDLVPVKSERDEGPSETENRRCTSLYGKHADAKPFGNKKVFRREGDALGGLQQSGGGGRGTANNLSLRTRACCCEEMRSFKPIPND